MSSSTMSSGSKYSFRSRGSCAIYVEFDAYRDLGILHLSFFRGYAMLVEGDIWAGKMDN